MKANPTFGTSEVDRLLRSLEIDVVALSECLVSAGHRLELGAHEAPGLHYILTGSGRMTVKGGRGIDLAPHTLVIMPPGHAFSIEMTSGAGAMQKVNGSDQRCSVDGINRFVAGSTDPRMIMVCGYFRATCGPSLDIFRDLATPIVERFSPDDRLDQKLRAALDELVSQEIGAGAMTSALLKQVVLTLLRRSLASLDLWAERFSVLSDPQVGRALAAMVADPGAAHTVLSLAENACLSRSAFMARFSSVVGRSPMLVLRDLRMRQAAEELGAGSHGVDRVSRNAGYSSKSSFVRAFKQAYGVDPSSYRTAHRVSSANA